MTLLRDLRLVDFRCFERLEFSPGPGKTFLVGRNAQGKTSLLEAACVLLRLQSPRTTTLNEAVRSGCPGFAVDGHFGDAHLACQWSDGGRKAFLDSKPQGRSDDYLATARVAWFANTDLELVRGGGSVRRRYLDFLGLQCVSGYRRALRDYERALRSRNALLKDNRPRREIAAFDEPLVTAGEELRTGREILCSALRPLAHAACREISGSEDDLDVVYKPGATAPLHEALAASRPDEERLRQTVVGPHRDDLILTLQGMPAAAYASEGQQRSIALALKMAQARHLTLSHGRPPLFLLDDVFGELDQTRRNLLLASLPYDAQALITTTFLDWAGETGQDTIFELSERRLTRRSS